MTDLIENTKFMRDFIRLAQEGVEHGWHEKNGGNLSYRIALEEINEIKDFLKEPEESFPTEISVPNLAGEYFLVTGSGKYLKNVSLAPFKNLAIVLIDDKGENYKIVWGLSKEEKPTSEFPTHLECHSIKKEQNASYRVIYHAHPVNIIALSATLPCDDDIVTKATWGMMTECPVIYPEGLGIVPWMVPGGREIANATAEKMRKFKYNAVIWALHGIFCAGKNFDDTIELMYVIEKSAEIYKAQKIMGGAINSIPLEGYKKLEEEFHVHLKESSLNAIIP